MVERGTLQYFRQYCRLKLLNIATVNLMPR